MNRYLLTAKSLISNSWLVRITLCVFTIANILLAVYGNATGIVILFVSLLVGTGYTTRCYVLSERRRLVPGMNETCAAVSIALLILAWVVCSVAVCGLHGFAPEAIGGCLFGLAISLWIGCFEKATAPALVIPYILPLLWLLYKDTSRQIFDAYVALPLPAHFLAGAVLLLLGIAVTARFWFLTTSKYSPLVYQRANASKESGSYALIGFGFLAVLLFANIGISYAIQSGSQRSAANWGEAAFTIAAHTAIAFSICGVLYALWRGLIEYFSPANQSITHLGHFLFGTANGNTWKLLPWMIFGVFLVSFGAIEIFEGSKTDQAIHAKIGFGLLYPCFITSVVVLHGLPKLFSRLWLTGASGSRFNTAIVLLLTLLSRTLPSTLVVIAWILTMSMSASTGLPSTLIIATGSVAVGAMTVWTIVRIYPLLARHAGFFVLTYLAAAGIALVALVSNSNELILGLTELTTPFGPWICVVTAIALSTGICLFCVWDAARFMGSSAELMETNNDSFTVVHQQ